MPKPSLGPRRQFLIRVPEDLYAEAALLHPEWQDPRGGFIYGAINNYFVALVQGDVERRKQMLQKRLRND